MLRPAVVLAVVAAFACAACGSDGDDGHRRKGGPAREDLAGTPEGAALGFEDSLDHHATLRFDCLPRRFSTAGLVPTGPVTARARRLDATTWSVTLSVTSNRGEPLHRWEVHKRGDGYCVSGELPTRHPHLAPSSPGSGREAYSPSRTP